MIIPIGLLEKIETENLTRFFKQLPTGEGKLTAFFTLLPSIMIEFSKKTEYRNYFLAQLGKASLPLGDMNDVDVHSEVDKIKMRELASELITLVENIDSPFLIEGDSLNECLRYYYLSDRHSNYDRKSLTYFESLIGGVKHPYELIALVLTYLDLLPSYLSSPQVKPPISNSIGNFDAIKELEQQLYNVKRYYNLDDTLKTSESDSPNLKLSLEFMLRCELSTAVYVISLIVTRYNDSLKTKQIQSFDGEFELLNKIADSLVKLQQSGGYDKKSLKTVNKKLKKALGILNEVDN